MKKDGTYTYDMLETDLNILTKEFPELESGIIGKSLWGRKLYYIRIGSGQNKILYNGAHHGMEWITAALLMKFVREYMQAKKSGVSLGGFSIPAIDKSTSVYIVPMVNPDGVELAANGMPDNLDEDDKARLVKMNGSGDFSRWQANGAGVDLNHNYDALWHKSKVMEKEYGVYGPGPTRYSGAYAESEPESHALAEFTRQQDFKMVIAFHSQGRVIYYDFENKEPSYAIGIAKAFTCISPYVLDNTEGIASYAGFKDWFIDCFNRPGYTVEVGIGENPLSCSKLVHIYKETLPIMLGAMTVILP